MHEMAAWLDRPRLCNRTLEERAYRLPARWPFGHMHLVMETRPGLCDLYASTVECCMATNASSGVYERHVDEALGSVLMSCKHRLRSGSPCRSIDLGANNGWISLMMLQMGSAVVAVEPQSDLARAAAESAALNCWASRFRILNARACAGSANSFAACMKPASTDLMISQGWRLGHSYRAGKPRLQTELRAKRGAEWPRLAGLPTVVGGVSLYDVLKSAAEMATGAPRAVHATRTVRGMAGAGASAEAAEEASVPQLELIKMDADGREGEWLSEIEERIANGSLVVRHMLIEGNHLAPLTMMRLQQRHAYTFYRLDAHDGRRYITRNGWDAFSPPGTFARLDRMGAEHDALDRRLQHESVKKQLRIGPNGRPIEPMGDGVSRRQLEEELFGVRAMRHVFRVLPNVSLQGWVSLLNPVLRPGFPPQWLITLDGDLTEPAGPAPLKQPMSAPPEERAAEANGWFLSRAAHQWRLRK